MSVHPHTLRSGLFSFPTSCALGGPRPCVSAVDTSHPPSASQDPVCLSLHGKQLRNRKPTKSSIIFFSVFLQEPSSAMYRICLFLGGGGRRVDSEIALHVRYEIITCLCENSE